MTYEEIVKKWKDGTIGGDKSFADIFTSFSVLFSYNSCLMANEFVTYEPLKELFETGTIETADVSFDALDDIRNASEGWDLLLEKMGEKEKLSDDMVRDFHLALTAGTYCDEYLQAGEEPGFYRKNDYVAEINEVGAFPQDVEEEMGTLIEQVNKIKPEKALVASAYFHSQFENIHPFADGNGRTGRLLMNYILLLNDDPPVVIFREDIDDYFDALTAWDDEEDIAPMIDFLKDQTVKTWETILEA